MLINQGRNRGLLFILRTSVSFPSPTGIMLVGTKLVGVKVNMPYLELDFGYQGFTEEEVTAIMQGIDDSYTTELTWRIIDLRGNANITDTVLYNSLIAKGFEIYGNIKLDGIFSRTFSSTFN